MSPYEYDFDRPYEPLLGALSLGQLQCLVLVAEGLTSKEIALALRISSHTVDERLKRCLKLLGVPSRREAGRIIATSHNWETYQQLVYQSPGLANVPHAPLSPRLSSDFRLDEKAEGTQRRAHSKKTLFDYLPFPTSGREVNRLSIPARIVVIIILAILISLAFGSLVSAVESLSNFLR